VKLLLLSVLEKEDLENAENAFGRIMRRIERSSFGIGMVVSFTLNK
jgi:hypothetical protein